ncbi:hypothetical protein RB601_000719 [Gaeumannomyces tritici]
MEDPSGRQSLFPGWLPQTPIPGVSLSAGGLLALADLSTVQQRTALTGGSSWLDSLLLVPGLHYQQAAGELARRTGLPPSLPTTELRPDGSRAAAAAAPSLAVNNAALSQFCQRVARDAELVTLDVGRLPPRGRRRADGTAKGRGGPGLGAKRRRLVRGDGGLEAAYREGDDDDNDDDPDELVVPDFGWLSHLLYLMGPLLTLGAIALLVLIHDWWALGCICALMLSRLLNIWVIKQRAARNAAPHAPSRHPSTASCSAASSSSASTSQPRRQQRRLSRQQQQQQQQATAHNHAHPPPPDHALVSLLVTLPDGRKVCLRGTAADLAGAAGSAWLRAETHVEGYLEAAAKLCVHLVAAVSGNWTQAGALVVMLLLLVSAALLALSNANARRLDVAGGYVAVPGGRRGRVAVVEPANGGGEVGGGVGGDT